MIGKTHLIIGTAVGLALVANSHPPAPALVVTAAAIGALLPDLDSHGSLIARKTGPFGWLYPYFVSHRGITHSAVALVMVLLGVALLHRDYPGSEMAGFALWCGYLSHLTADMVTKAGIPLLWPSERKFRLLPRRLAIVTGGKRESLVSLAVLVLAFYLVYVYTVL